MIELLEVIEFVDTKVGGKSEKCDSIKKCEQRSIHGRLVGEESKEPRGRTLKKEL